MIIFFLWYVINAIETEALFETILLFIGICFGIFLALAMYESYLNAVVYPYTDNKIYRRLYSKLYAKARNVEENGVNLSGGEGQKLAVVRVFYKDANLIILDEPSSALDPIAEYHLNHSMLTAAENKSVVFIYHRLSTTRIADRIYMLEKGRIIETGSHAGLLDHNGKYAEMWRVQAEQLFLYSGNFFAQFSIWL